MPCTTEANIVTVPHVPSQAEGALEPHVKQESRLSFAKARAQKAAPMVFNKVVRKLFQRYWRWRRALTIGVRGIVVDHDGRILLVRHTYTEGWNLPGGGVEFGETLEQSLVRELDEEGGIIVEGPPELIGIYDNRVAFPGDHVATYVIRRWRRDRVPAPNMEIAETGFFHPDALPDTTVPPARRRIEEMLGKRSAEATW